MEENILMNSLQSKHSQLLKRVTKLTRENGSRKGLCQGQSSLVDESKKLVRKVFETYCKNKPRTLEVRFLEYILKHRGHFDVL